MFGGANDNTAAAPADQQDEPVHTGMLDTAGTNVPAGGNGGYDAGTYGDPGTPANATAITDTATVSQAVAPASNDLLDQGGNDDLLSIKQQALQQLSPLVGHLEQTPEEKFRTTMMMIQASDNADLIKEAFEAAKQITDDKVRAQALLDVVNEINYFTQHNEQQQ